MNYEQNYKEALERAKAEQEIFLKRGNVSAKTAIERIFPELRESEDEKIRKEIIQSIQDNMCVIHKDKCIAWLEKQGEQHSWSKEDEHCVELLLTIIDSSSLIPKNRKKCKEFLKSLKPNHWKPSEEQMEALKKRTHGLHTSSETRKALESLIDDLTKL